MPAFRASAPIAWASSGRSPIVASSLSTPSMRADAPAATTIASARVAPPIDV
jgi:hypothetical protein